MLRQCNLMALKLMHINAPDWLRTMQYQRVHEFISINNST